MVFWKEGSLERMGKLPVELCSVWFLVFGRSYTDRSCEGGCTSSGGDGFRGVLRFRL